MKNEILTSKEAKIGMKIKNLFLENGQVFQICKISKSEINFFNVNTNQINIQSVEAFNRSNFIEIKN